VVLHELRPVAIPVFRVGRIRVGARHEAISYLVVSAAEGVERETRHQRVAKIGMGVENIENIGLEASS